jgi:hypothetical protein
MNWVLVSESLPQSTSSSSHISKQVLVMLYGGEYKVCQYNYSLGQFQPLYRNETVYKWAEIID